MARKITEKAIYNFLRGHAFNLQNTSVIIDGDKVKLLLWGNCIAYYDKNEKSVYFSLCGYNTNTTRERLRGLGLNIRTRAGVIYWGKHEIDGYKYHDSGIIAF